MIQQDKWLMQLKLVPELESILHKRYRLLQMIEMTQPVGRRTLADLSKLTERHVRKETSILKQEGLIEIHQTGMICTDLGKKVIEGLREFIYNITGLLEKENQLAEKLQIQKVIIAENISENAEVKRAMVGKLAATMLMSIMNEKDIVAVTGGTSVAAIAQHLYPLPEFSKVQFVAARGGLGQSMSTQANMIASEFSQACGAISKLLFVPESLSKQSYDVIREEPIIKEVTSLYDEVSIVVHGIGEAMEMAKRRNASENLLAELQRKGAVGEAFGYYFNANGEIVHQIASIGIQLHQVKKASHILAIAFGESKVNAITAYLKNGLAQTILITDEHTADLILQK